MELTKIIEREVEQQFEDRAEVVEGGLNIDKEMLIEYVAESESVIEAVDSMIADIVDEEWDLLEDHLIDRYNRSMEPHPSLTAAERNRR